MSRTEFLDDPLLVVGEKKVWSPKVKLILAFLDGALLLSPAILGSYWEAILSK